MVSIVARTAHSDLCGGRIGGSMRSRQRVTSCDGETQNVGGGGALHFVGGNPQWDAERPARGAKGRNSL